MNTKRVKRHPFRRGWWWKTLIGLAVLLVVSVTIVLLNINPIAHTVANRILQRFLPAGGVLDGIDIQLGAGVVEITGLTIHTPQGFGEEPLLTLGAARVDVDPASLASGEIVVRQMAVQALSLVVVRDRNGQLSPLKLLPSGGADSEKAPAAENPVEKDPPKIPSIRVEKIRLEEIALHVIDHLAGGARHARLGLDLSVDDIQLKDILKQDILLGRLELAIGDISIDQPEGFSRAPLLSLDNVKLKTTGVNLGTSRLPVDELRLANLTASVERDETGVTNIQRLIEAWLPPASEGSRPDPPDEIIVAEAGDAPSSFSIPTVEVKDIQLKSLALQVLDVIDGQPWRAGFDNLDIGVTDLAVGDVARKALSLGTFALDLKGVAVDQPPGYKPDKLAGLKQFTVRTDKLDLASPELVVKTIAIQGPTATLLVDANGISNLQKLKAALLGTKQPAEASSKPPRIDKGRAESGQALPVVRFEKIQVSDGSIYYYDSTIIEGGLALPLKNARLEAKQLTLFASEAAAEPASVEGAFELDQPGELPVARFGTWAVIGPVNTVPPVNAQVRFIGFKLDTLGDMVPPATRTTLGASGFDAHWDLALNKDSINLFAWILTDHQVEYNTMHIYGPLNKPTLEIADFISGAFNRISDGLVNLGGDTLDAGVSIAKGGISVVGEVGSGAWTVGKNLGVSALEMGTGLLTLDGEQLREGFDGATTDTVNLTLDSAGGAGSAAGDGLGESMSDLTAADRIQAWDQAIPDRYQTAMQQAREALQKMPYPPEFD